MRVHTGISHPFFPRLHHTRLHRHPHTAPARTPGTTRHKSSKAWQPWRARRSSCRLRVPAPGRGCCKTSRQPTTRPSGRPPPPWRSWTRFTRWQKWQRLRGTAGHRCAHVRACVRATLAFTRPAVMNDPAEASVRQPCPPGPACGVCRSVCCTPTRRNGSSAMICMPSCIYTHICAPPLCLPAPACVPVCGRGGAAAAGHH